MMESPEFLKELSGFPTHRKYAIKYYSDIEEKESWISCANLKDVARIIYNFRMREVPFRVIRVKDQKYFSDRVIHQLIERYAALLRQKNDKAIKESFFVGFEEG